MLILYSYTILPGRKSWPLSFKIVVITNPIYMFNIGLIDALHVRTHLEYDRALIKTTLAFSSLLTLKVLVMTIDARWEGIGDVGSARYEPTLLPPCPTIRVLSYSN